MLNRNEIISLFGPLPTIVDSTTAAKLKKKAKQVLKLMKKDGHRVELSALLRIAASCFGFGTWHAFSAAAHSVHLVDRQVPKTDNSAIGVVQTPVLVQMTALVTPEAPFVVTKRILAQNLLKPLEQMEMERIEAEEAAQEAFAQMEMERIEAEEAAETNFDGYVDDWPVTNSHWSDGLDPDIQDFAATNFDNLEDFEEYMDSRD